MPNQYDYDAIIIGAGISGLVCGCYLAKAGMKTLIVEKNANPGGYCTSFKRGGFTFDACVHSLGSLRKDGILRTILRELDLEHRIEIKRHDPSDIMITPDFKIHFWNDLSKTVKEFQDHFPKESGNIDEFFNYMNNYGVRAFIDLESITFQEVLDKYFEDNKLKAILSLPLLGNAGLPASHISAIVGAFIYKEFMIDGGYYPNDSIQSLADILARRFEELGGEIWFSHLVNKVIVEKKKARGVKLEKEEDILAKYIIASSDVTQVVTSFLGQDIIDKEIAEQLKGMVPSLSAFILYLGMDSEYENVPVNTGIWHLPHYDISKMYNAMLRDSIEEIEWFLTRLSPDKKSLYLFVNSPYKDETYWKLNKKRLIDVFINKMETVYPHLSSHIVYKDAATPSTLQKWTMNYNGAAYGWAWVPSQYAVADLTKKTLLENLYLTGHWTTLAQGVAGVAYVGRDTSKKILNNNIHHT